MSDYPYLEYTYENVNRQLGEILWAMATLAGSPTASTKVAMDYWGELSYKYRDELVNTLSEIDSRVGAGGDTGAVVLSGHYVDFNRVWDFINLLNAEVAGVVDQTLPSAFRAQLKQDGVTYERLMKYALQEVMPSVLQEIGYTTKPNIPEIYNSLIALKPHLGYDAQPAIDDLGDITGQIYEGLHDGDLQGEPWYTKLLDNAWGAAEDLATDSLLHLWDRLRRLMLWAAGANARFWWAMIEYVIDALWKDENMDTEILPEDREDVFGETWEDLAAIEAWGV